MSLKWQEPQRPGAHAPVSVPRGAVAGEWGTQEGGAAGKEMDVRD